LNGQVSKTDADGTGTVRTDAGEICCGLLGGLSQGANVVVVVRPESVVLHRQKPAQTKNIIEGKAGPPMFLGEYVNSTLEIGKSLMQPNQPYTRQVRRGDPVWVELPAGECMALPAEA